jgi:hypothetical protein
MMDNILGQTIIAGPSYGPANEVTRIIGGTVTYTK